MKKNAKAEKVIDCALFLLKTGGDHGVTMRQVAQRAEMSLSNVQYYFKSRDDLLKAMADRYFYDCLTEFSHQENNLNQQASAQENYSLIHELLTGLLSHGLAISDMCRIFREYWAIGTRNAEIDAYLVKYYQDLGAVIADKLRAVSRSPEGLAAAISFIIPFVEGYSITCRSLPNDVEVVTNMLTDIVVGHLMSAS